MSKPTDERYTPDHVRDLVHAFDAVALDPCTIAANPMGAATFYTKEDDGLTKAWHGLAYVNPPYSRGQIDKWTARVCDAWTGSDVESLLLVPADMSTRWTKRLFRSATAVGMFDVRLKFYKPDGRFDSGAKFGNAMWYFGERQGRFRRVFSPHATVITLR